jgi:hypothetical protein
VRAGVLDDLEDDVKGYFWIGMEWLIVVKSGLMIDGADAE